ncbi:MAG: hypothetical protein HY054_15315 [Proteobacteria bacterium]|nr:hypothetical protein [Pseudomonadota bacterium]
MRVLIGAAAALLFAASAAAQTASTPATPATPTPPPSACGETAAPPAQPDMAHVTSAQMTNANRDFEAWATDARAKLQCRQNEVRALAAQTAAAEAAYNTQAASFNTSVNSWNAATTAYNSQHARSANPGNSGGTASSGRHSNSTLGQHGPS